MAPRAIADPNEVVTCPKCGLSGPAVELLYFYKLGPNTGRPISLRCRKCTAKRLPLVDPTVERICTKCGMAGPTNELFYINEDGTLRFTWCKECEIARTRKYDVEHRPRRKVGPRKPPRRNRKHVIVSGVECKPCTKCGEVLPLDRFSVQKRKNKEPGYAGQCKACRTKFEKEQRLAGQRVIPIEIQRERSQRWRDANPEVARMGVRRRRARKRQNGGVYTTEEWLEMLEIHGHVCAYCGKDESRGLHADHVIPVARGGSDDIENIVPACQRCNLSKGARTADEFVDYRGVA